MDRQSYESYLDAFNSGDIDQVLGYYHDTLSVCFAGLELTTRDAVRAFYSFFHRHVEERIELVDFVSGDASAYLEAIVRLRCIRSMDAQEAKSRYPGLVVLSEGDSFVMRQLLQYKIDGGRFRSVTCAIVPDTAVSISQ